AVDIFASEREEVQERARAIAAKSSAEGSPIALERALELAQQEQEVQDTDVAYQLRKRDLFAAVGIELSTYTDRPEGGSRATPEQLALFKRSGLPIDKVAGLSASQADQLREQLLDRKAVGLCTPRQARALVEQGIDPRDVYQDEAKRLLAEFKAAKRR
ncbi:MAG: hypothetical protein AAF368_09915, partial [Planctomycetota bacterium]